MKTGEANKIIAEYMGWYREHATSDFWLYGKPERHVCSLDQFPYSESLDALVPVWEKLKEAFYLDYKFLPLASDNFVCYIRILSKCGEYFDDFMEGEAGTAQEAAAVATAKAIQELTKALGEELIDG